MSAVLPSESTPLFEVAVSQVLRARRIFVLALILCGTLLSFFVSGSISPAIPSISEEMGVSASVVSFSFSGAAFLASFLSHRLSSYLVNRGRKNVYFIGQLLVVAGSFGLTSSRTVPQLALWRFVQTLGGSPGLSSGQDGVGDIQKLDEKAKKLSLMISHLGPTLAPVFGGLCSSITSWKSSQIFLAVWGLVAFILTTVFSKVISDVSSDVNQTLAVSDNFKPAPEPEFESNAELTFSGDVNKLNEARGKVLLVIKLLRRPYILAVIMAEVFVVLTNQVVLMPLSLTVGTEYDGLANKLVLGSCFFLTGLGNCISTPISSFISDRAQKYRDYRRQALGTPTSCPEDRLVGAVVACATIVPLSVLGLGLSAAYLNGVPGLLLNFLCLFLNGVGVTLVLSPTAAYIADVMVPEKPTPDAKGSKDVTADMAAIDGMRPFFTQIALAIVMPMIDSAGLVWTNAGSAFLAWLGFGYDITLVVRIGIRRVDERT
ncbi:hypothetical protein D9757_008335 [Collybiopsis confluens]|uniref:MFS transporter n=1 Tax=Collybiopsis confluens TaxID=2823264 RepID=A0A8H5M5V1_9AGAR|nr:hypothetical protein D9757_008335 [Collybiopsis confluens]